jgi:hypothetical protein
MAPLKDGSNVVVVRSCGRIGFSPLNALGHNPIQCTSTEPRKATMKPPRGSSETRGRQGPGRLEVSGVAPDPLADRNSPCCSGWRLLQCQPRRAGCTTGLDVSNSAKCFPRRRGLDRMTPQARTSATRTISSSSPMRMWRSGGSPGGTSLYFRPFRSFRGRPNWQPTDDFHHEMLCWRCVRCWHSARNSRMNVRS